MPGLELNRYYRYEELTQWLHAMAERHPERLRVESIGKSHEGRDIWLATVTSFETGSDVEKPALWVDATIHASELAPGALCMHLIDWLLRRYSEETDVRRCLDTRAFYICPRVNPDGAELALADRPRIIRSSTRPYPYEDQASGGLVAGDVDGDGRILSMRIEDPNGAWKICPEEPRLLVRRDPAETGGTYYRVLPEGHVEDYDGKTLSIQPRAEGLDLNRNFPAGWRPQKEQAGAGPYPTSEPEVRAVVDFLVGHRNVIGGVAGHTYAGMLLRPFSDQSDECFHADDLRTYQTIGAKASELFGYPAVSVYHDFRSHPTRVITGALDDWMFDHLGVFAWTLELWSPERRAGVEPGNFFAWQREHPLEDELRLLRWSDEELRGEGYVDWYPFDHPQLGRVEIGGWNQLHALYNPPPHLLEREIEPVPRWLLWHLLISPRLELLYKSVTPVGAGFFHVQVVLQNTGWLPTYVTHHALDRGLVRGVVCDLELPEGSLLLNGAARMEAGQMEGRAHKTVRPDADPTDERIKLDWLLRCQGGGRARMVARHDRAGVVRVDLPLE